MFYFRALFFQAIPDACLLQHRRYQHQGYIKKWRKGVHLKDASLDRDRAKVLFSGIQIGLPNGQAVSQGQWPHIIMIMNMIITYLQKSFPFTQKRQ